MNDILQVLIDEYDKLISLLEDKHEENKAFLEDAEKKKNVPALEMSKRMSFARDNKKRLEVARAERELLSQNLAD